MLLEVMIAIILIAIGMMAALGSQSHGISFATEAKFYTNAVMLSQKKMSEIETQNLKELISDSGNFEEPFESYKWELDLKDYTISNSEGDLNYLMQLDLKISSVENEKSEYALRSYNFHITSE